MNKRGWHTPKGLILIGIIAVTLIANYINFFDNSITGNIIRTSDTEIKLEINNQINFNEKIITLLTVNQKNILISVDEIKKEIRLGETEIVNGLLIKPIETDPREVFGGARFLVRDGTLNNQNSEQSSGIFKFHFDESLVINGLLVKVIPTKENDKVRLLVNDVNKKLEEGEEWEVYNQIFKINKLKKHIDNEFSIIELIIKKGPEEFISPLDTKLDLPSNYPMTLFDKELILIKTSSMKDGKAQFSVDGVTNFINLNSCKIINGLQICLSKIENSENEEFDRATVNIKKELKEYIFNSK